MAAVREVAFELETFEWADERLEVAGRWRGVGARRLSRPVLTVETAGARRKRIVALPGGAPGANGETWRASFGWPGDPGEITGAALEVGGNLLVDLPLPDRKRRRRRRSSQDTSDDVLRGEVGALRSQIERLRAELAGREREILTLREQLDRQEEGGALASDEAHTVEVQRLEGELAQLRDAEATRAEDLTIEVDRLVQERDAAHAAADEAVAAERERWQVDLSDLRQSFADAAAEAEATRERHEAEVAELEAQLRIERAEVARLLAAAAASEAAIPPPTPAIAAAAEPEPEPKAEDTVESDVLEPPEELPEPSPTARFAAWVRETVAPELGGPIPSAPESTRAESPNGTVAPSSSWLRGADEPTAGDPTAPTATPPAPTSRIPAWLRGAPPAEPDEPGAEPGEPAAGPPSTLSSRIPAWLRGTPPARADGDARADEADDTVADETADERAEVAPADADEVEADDDNDADVARDDDPAAEDDDLAGDDDTPTRVTATDARDQTTEAYEPDDDEDEEPVGDDARAHEVRAAALGARPPQRAVDEEGDDGHRGVNWPKLDTDAFAALRERFRRPPREDVVHDENGAPVLARPIRTRTESRVRHGATIAAGRTPAEVWTLRIGAAIVVAILLTAFVLLLAYLA